jgi:Chaperone of endosialidase
MSRNRIRTCITLAGFSAAAAYASAPGTPFTPTTDTGGNTAIGTGTLTNLGTPNTGVMPFISARNTATGWNSLNSDTSGSSNTALGAASLNLNTSGDDNTAIGQAALLSNTIGNNNIAVGSAALDSNISGSNNSANGYAALFSNTNGTGNNAVGSQALFNNTTGNFNTADGYLSLLTNTSGIYNAAYGAATLQFSQGANENTAMGTGALRYDTTGFGNSATGFTALYNNTIGSFNTAIGSGAGFALTTGSYNTYVGYGITGASGDNNVTRIGASTAGTAATFITGIYNTPLSGNAVVVTSSGQLGVAAVSSERFKTDIAAMGTNTGKLSKLRPVTFKLKTDAQGTIQYGLIAEEVAKVYPELVIRDEHGRIDGVRYDELAPMLLNEVQQQAAKIASLEQQLAGIQAALIKMQPKDEFVVQR